MKTILICHKEFDLDREGLGRWLASFSDLAGIIVLEEPKKKLWQRIQKEWKRIGGFRFIDVLALRLYYKLFLDAADRRWIRRELEKIARKYAPIPASTQTLYTDNPNSVRAKDFLKELQPDLVLARCRFILKEEVFTIASVGTFVMHPGICPEYRNAHGCFWALACRDLGNVGMTLLKIDKGVDTGPVYGYYSYDYDEVNESHIIIQYRMTFENLETLEQRLCQIVKGNALPLDTSGRNSRVWGQPWLTEYIKWKKEAKRRKREGTLDPLPRRY